MSGIAGMLKLLADLLVSFLIGVPLLLEEDFFELADGGGVIGMAGMFGIAGINGIVGMAEVLDFLE